MPATNAIRYDTAPFRAFTCLLYAPRLPVMLPVGVACTLVTVA